MLIKLQKDSVVGTLRQGFTCCSQGFVVFLQICTSLVQSMSEMWLIQNSFCKVCVSLFQLSNVPEGLSNKPDYYKGEHLGMVYLNDWGVLGGGCSSSPACLGQSDNGFPFPGNSIRQSLCLRGQRSWLKSAKIQRNSERCKAPGFGSKHSNLVSIQPGL